MICGEMVMAEETAGASYRPCTFDKEKVGWVVIASIDNHPTDRKFQLSEGRAHVEIKFAPPISRRQVRLQEQDRFLVSFHSEESGYYLGASLSAKKD